jgi:hypothetical protein
MAINNTSLTGTASAVYVSSGNTVVTTIHLCNYTGTQVQANVYLSPSTGNVANGTTIIYGNVSISAYNTLIIYQEKFVLANGDTIWANVSATNSVTATVSSFGI